ncbi:MAG: hypothetical protein RMM06_07600 [Armatimonadota bacterium]|nr:hypothetical protein [Armatimonadota bacterium]MDW8104058.1 hypothetical protein [Armatimonadota bacterium]MDW8290572.1 hypothetical protein [Armatimonadota bacterium]
MKVVRLLVLLGLVLVVALQFRSCLRPSMTGQPAAELSASHWWNSPPLALQQLRGQLVLLDFWAVW